MRNNLLYGIFILHLSGHRYIWCRMSHDTSWTVLIEEKHVMLSTFGSSLAWPQNGPAPNSRWLMITMNLLCKHACLRRARLVALMDWYGVQQLFWERSGSRNCLNSENPSQFITQKPHNHSRGQRGVVWMCSCRHHKQKRLCALLCACVQWRCGEGTASQEWGQLVLNCKGCIITSRFQHKLALVHVVQVHKGLQGHKTSWKTGHIFPWCLD